MKFTEILAAIGGGIKDIFTGSYGDRVVAVVGTILIAGYITRCTLG